MSVSVIYIDGCCPDTLELEEFSVDFIKNKFSNPEWYSTDEDDITWEKCTEVKYVNKQVIVTLFDGDGAAEFFIGSELEFKNPNILIETSIEEAYSVAITLKHIESGMYIGGNRLVEDSIEAVYFEASSLEFETVESQFAWNINEAELLYLSGYKPEEFKLCVI